MSPALANGLELLELITGEQEIGFSQLQNRSGLNTSSLNRMLKVLLSMGYIKKNNEGKYTKGTRLFLLLQGQNPWSGLVPLLQPVLEQISQEFKVTAAFYVYCGEQIILLQKVMDPDNVSLRGAGEAKSDFTCSPWGWLYLAEATLKERAYLIKKFADSTDLLQVELHQLQKYIEEVSISRRADDQGRLNKNIRRLAVPVYGPRRQLSAALGAGTFINMLGEEDVSRLMDSLALHADKLSRELTKMSL